MRHKYHESLQEYQKDLENLNSEVVKKPNLSKKRVQSAHKASKISHKNSAFSNFSNEKQPKQVIEPRKNENQGVFNRKLSSMIFSTFEVTHQSITPSKNRKFSSNF